MAQAPKGSGTTAVPKNSGGDAGQVQGQGVTPADESRSSAIRSLNEQFDAKHKSLDEQYSDKLKQIRAEYMSGLADLATKAQGTEANEAYQRLFSYAIATDQYEQAGPAATQLLKTESQGNDEPRDLARYIVVVALAERADHEQAVAALKSFLGRDAGQGTSGQPAPEQLLALGEDLIQRLLRAGKNDLAEQVAALFSDRDLDKSIVSHFQQRQTQIGLIGQPAPPISAVDVDGQPFQLDTLQGKVVLVNFWATWCPPCVAQVPRLNELYSQFADQNFEVLGVNLDMAREEVKNRQDALPAVRGLLINYGVTWPNVLSGGTEDFAEAYGVAAIPTNVLIGRDGRVLAVDLASDQLEERIQDALGGASTSRTN